MCFVPGSCYCACSWYCSYRVLVLCYVLFVRVVCSYSLSEIAALARVPSFFILVIVLVRVLCSCPCPLLLIFVHGIRYCSCSRSLFLFLFADRVLIRVLGLWSDSVFLSPFSGIVRVLCSCSLILFVVLVLWYVLFVLVICHCDRSLVLFFVRVLWSLFLFLLLLLFCVLVRVI